MLKLKNLYLTTVPQMQHNSQHIDHGPLHTLIIHEYRKFFYKNNEDLRPFYQHIYQKLRHKLKGKPQSILYRCSTCKNSLALPWSTEQTTQAKNVSHVFSTKTSFKKSNETIPEYSAFCIYVTTKNGNHTNTYKNFQIWTQTNIYIEVVWSSKHELNNKNHNIHKD